MFKKCKIIMLPVNKKSNIYLNKYADNINKADKLVFGGNIENELTNPLELLIDRGYQAQHLYIISDDEIKEGDWVIDTKSLPQDAPTKKIDNINETHLTILGCSSRFLKDYHKKIIATTDNSLHLPLPKNCDLGMGVSFFYDKFEGFDEYRMLLPQPSKQFIEHFISEYNKGNIITDVMVEYESDLIVDDESKTFEQPDVLKINPKDNTINIRKFKDTWNREEVIEFAVKYHNMRINENMIIYNINNWIENNL